MSGFTRINPEVNVQIDWLTKLGKRKLVDKGVTDKKIK